MTISDSFEFKQHMVGDSPTVPGIYFLVQGNEIIYIGKADESIRRRLLCHLNGDEGPCTQNATHYGFEIRPDAAAAEVGYLQQYKAQHGKLPRCNDVMPGSTLSSLAGILSQ